MILVHTHVWDLLVSATVRAPLGRVWVDSVMPVFCFFSSSNCKITCLTPSSVHLCARSHRIEGCWVSCVPCLPCWPVGQGLLLWGKDSAIFSQSHEGALKAARCYCGETLTLRGPAVPSHPRDSAFPSTQWKEQSLTCCSRFGGDQTALCTLGRKIKCCWKYIGFVEALAPWSPLIKGCASSGTGHGSPMP